MYLLIHVTQVFSNACFYSSGQESSECFLFPKSRKNAFLWSNPIIFDSGDQESLCLWLLCQIILIFPVVQPSAAAGRDKREQSAGALSPLSDALPLDHHHLRPFPPRAVSRFLLRQKWDSCFDNGHCGSHQMQETFWKKIYLKYSYFLKVGVLQKQEVAPEKLSIPGTREVFSSLLILLKQPAC